MQPLIPLTRPAELKAEGIPFETEESARWAYRRRHENGLADAFVNIGRRVFIDAVKFHELVRQSHTS
jgi:hypothetical protein